MAIDVALNRKLVGDMMIQMRRLGTITGVDASSCYNRVRTFKYVGST